MTDIEDAFKRLDNLTREEVQMAIAQVLKATSEIKEGTQPHCPVTNSTLNHRPLRYRESPRGYETDGEHGERNDGERGRN
jgi:hypothetical protein